jgi:hypothetical protein
MDVIVGEKISWLFWRRGKKVHGHKEHRKEKETSG